jgi:alpha-L-fucosidase 2
LLHLGLAIALAVAPGCRGEMLPTAPKLPETGSELFTVAIVANSTAVEVGRTLALQLDGQDENGGSVDIESPTKWESSDPKIATVDSRGIVRGVKLGRVTITVTTTNPAREAKLTLQVVGVGQAPAGSGSGGFDTGTDVEVPSDTPAPAPTTPRPPSASTPAPAGMMLSIYPLTNRLGVGQSLRLIAYQGMSGAQAPAAAMWESADEAIATVDEAGMVTAKKAGAVTIVAQSVAYPALTREFVLTVVAPASSSDIQGIRIQPSAINDMGVGETLWLLAEVPTRTGSFDANIRWVVGDSSLLSVTQTGQITALAPGKTTVTAVATTWDAGELSATIPVTIRNSTSSR